MGASEATRNRAERRRAQTRAALVDAARTLFAEHGVEATTIQQIADTADVAKGSFYNHFHSRDEILEAVAGHTLEQLGAALDGELQVREEDPARVVAASLAATLHACVEDPTLGGFVLRTESLVDFVDAALGGRGRRDLERGLAIGRFDVDDVEVVLTAVVGAGQALLKRRLAGELTAAADRRLVALVLRMLGIGSEESNNIAAEVTGENRPASD